MYNLFTNDDLLKYIETHQISLINTTIILSALKTCSSQRNFQLNDSMKASSVKNCF